MIEIKYKLLIITLFAAGHRFNGPYFASAHLSAKKSLPRWILLEVIEYLALEMLEIKNMSQGIT
jgi:hypothetical protein